MFIIQAVEEKVVAAEFIIWVLAAFAQFIVWLYLWSGRVHLENAGVSRARGRGMSEKASSLQDTRLRRDSQPALPLDWISAATQGGRGGRPSVQTSRLTALFS